MIFRADEPHVLEVNASPGFRGLLEATATDAADAIVEYAAHKASAAETNMAMGTVPATHG